MRIVARALEERSEVVFGLIHGSFVEPGFFRDLDVAVFLNPDEAACNSFRSYEKELSVDLMLRLRLEVDVRVLNDAPVAFRYQALKGETCFVRDEYLLDEFRARTWDEYCDFAPFARQYLREALSE